MTFAEKYKQDPQNMTSQSNCYARGWKPYKTFLHYKTKHNQMNGGEVREKQTHVLRNLGVIRSIIDYRFEPFHRDKHED